MSHIAIRAPLPTRAVLRPKFIGVDDVTVMKRKHLGSGDKWYTPIVAGNRQLRLSFRTHTVANIYGRAVLERYRLKYAVMLKVQGDKNAS